MYVVSIKIVTEEVLWFRMGYADHPERHCAAEARQRLGRAGSGRGSSHELPTAERTR